MTELQYRYVALIDVLGYRYLLEKDRKLGKLDFKDKLTNALGILEQFNESIIKVQAISDTIIISCEEHIYILEFFDALRKIFIAFLREDLFIRGGVAYSRHYQNNHVTYSHAIARAYELEQQSAVYPRIVIDNNIIEMFKSGEGLPDILTSGMLCNEQGVYFLQMLSNDNWEEIYKLASDIYEKDKHQLNENAYSKHLRFQNLLLNSEFNVNGTGPFIPKINSLL